MNAIATQVPSYNARQTGTDMASQTLTASMRALSANHALVLVNGKRRHITSNVGASTGNAAADLSFIPSSAIERLEVLTDGAAAIYGSDAIAGVVNIILKDDYEGGTINTNVSEYTDGGGYTTNIQGDVGFGTDTAFLNLSVETEERDTVSRSITYGPAVCVEPHRVSEPSEQRHAQRLHGQLRLPNLHRARQQDGHCPWLSHPQQPGRSTRRIARIRLLQCRL